MCLVGSMIHRETSLLQNTAHVDEVTKGYAQAILCRVLASGLIQDTLTVPAVSSHSR